MFTNYKGSLIVSKAAARITPIGHSDLIPLRSVSINKLASNLAEDYRLEKEIAKDYVDAAILDSTFRLSDYKNIATQVAAQIVDNTNNITGREAGWDVVRGFTNRKGSKGGPLNRNKLSYTIPEALNVDEDDEYKNKDGDGFSLFKHTRFGPITLD